MPEVPAHSDGAIAVTLRPAAARQPGDDIGHTELDAISRKTITPPSEDIRAASKLAVISAAPPSAPADMAIPGLIEIAIGDAIVRVSGRVEAGLLMAVLRAVRRAS